MSLLRQLGTPYENFYRSAWIITYLVDTFVPIKYKNMIYRTFLEKSQVQDVSDALLSKKLKETCVDLCEMERICARNMVYQALNPEKYDAKNVIHRCVLDAAVRLLKTYGVCFEWEPAVEMPQVA